MLNRFTWQNRLNFIPEVEKLKGYLSSCVSFLSSQYESKSAVVPDSLLFQFYSSLLILFFVCLFVFDLSMANKLFPINDNSDWKFGFVVGLFGDFWVWINGLERSSFCWATGDRILLASLCCLFIYYEIKSNKKFVLGRRTAPQ